MVFRRVIAAFALVVGIYFAWTAGNDGYRWAIAGLEILLAAQLWSVPRRHPVSN